MIRRDQAFLIDDETAHADGYVVVVVVASHSCVAIAGLNLHAHFTHQDCIWLGYVVHLEYLVL